MNGHGNGRDSRGILVAGIGNIFLGDDGFGSAVADGLVRLDLPAGVKVIDYGIRGIDLAYALLEPYEAVILVDAVARGEAPGTVSLLQPSNPSAIPADTTMDAHIMDPMRLLAAAGSMGEVTAAIYLVGCEPLDFGEVLEGRMGLSDPVAASVPEAVRAVLDLIGRIRSPGQSEEGVLEKAANYAAQEEV